VEIGKGATEGTSKRAKEEVMEEMKEGRKEEKKALIFALLCTQPFYDGSCEPLARSVALSLSFFDAAYLFAPNNY